MEGLIIRNTGSWYQVRTLGGQIFDCKVKGTFRIKGIRSTNPVAVGDYVEITPNQEGTALITGIRDRRNYIIRKASNLSKQSHIIAANLDQVLLLCTINHPETSTTFMDRFLATAQAYRIPVILVFNKTDLYSQEELDKLDELTEVYQAIGYTCLRISIQQGTGLEGIKGVLKGKVTLLSGNSGVGKSSLINHLLPDLEQKARTAEISQVHDKGMHTTTFSQIYDLEGGGMLIDTPGIKGFGTFDMKEEEISHYFPEIFAIARDCRFSNCTHREEPGCAVLEAVKEGRIALSRYASYLSMLEDEQEGKYREAPH